MGPREGVGILVDGSSQYNVPQADCEDVTVCRLTPKPTEYGVIGTSHLFYEEYRMSERQVLNKKNLGITAGLPLTASDGGIEDLRKDIQRLMDIEAIKQLKHAYFRCVDTANLEELSTLFHDDVSVHFRGGHYEWKLQGKHEYVDNIGQSFTSEAVGQHNAHHPEVQILSDTEATAIWYLADNMWILNHNVKTHGTALYWDRYLKVDGRWLIKDTNYERIYELNDKLEQRPKFSSHYLSVHGRKIQP
jgi:hypothetical protein